MLEITCRWMAKCVKLKPGTFHSSVQIEAQENALFTERLEAAYVILKRFAPFSDIAALVTEYFRYRTNRFSKTVTVEDRVRPLAAITTFFGGDLPRNGGSAGATRGVELVVPEVEYCCMEAVRAMLRGDPVGALGQVSVSRKLQGGLHDPLREERLRLIEARAYVSIGAAEKARPLYQFLLNSTCLAFQSEASDFLFSNESDA